MKKPGNSRKAPAGPAKGEVIATRETRRLHGRSLRQACPRANHAVPLPGPAARDPLALLEHSNQGRVESLLPVRFTRMAESPFAFFRGTAILQAADLKGTPHAGIIVQSCGDCHLMNFGVFASPERTLLFDINDFDETFPAPFEWDVKRLATSVVLAARWRGFNDDHAYRIAKATVEAYRVKMALFAGMKILDVWYALTKVDDVMDLVVKDEKIRQRVLRRIDEAFKHTSEFVFHKLTKDVGGRPRIIDQPPLLYHLDSSELDMQRDVAPFIATYRNSLPPDRHALLDRFELVDVAFKVVGVGSVGTRCYVTLWMGDHDDPLFLQLKEARPSVLEGVAGPSPYSNNGERVVVGQRLMQSASDIFLGWAPGMHGVDYYVRQLRDHKTSADLTTMTPRILFAYGMLCGRTLARAHAKAGQAATIHGYLGASAKFDEAVAAYAVGYANQVEKDFADFQAAIRTGRFPVESLPSEIEASIR